MKWYFDYFTISGVVNFFLLMCNLKFLVILNDILINLKLYNIKFITANIDNKITKM